jgi:threonine synthase
MTAAKRWPRSALAGRESSMWRYREILPLLQSSKGVDPPVTVGEGWTPLLRARRLGATLGLRRLHIKDESVNPLGSFKARGASAAITRALHLGAGTIVAASSGHAGPAVAAYAARAALPVRVFIPKDVHPAFATAAAFHGAETVAIDGGDAEAGRAAAAWAAQAGSACDLTAFSEPYRVEGAKTIGYEIAEQLGWEVPDWILCPTASGTALVGLWKAFTEMASLGWIDPVRRPHIVAVQAAGAAPIVRAVGSGGERVEAWESAARTLADDLRVTSPAGGPLVLRAIRESGGAGIGVGDAEMVAEMKSFARLEGISAAPGGGATLHALRVLTAESRIKPHDTVVLVNPAAAGTYAIG